MILQALPDIPRAWTALAEWGACLVYVSAAWRDGDRRCRAAVVLAVALPAFLAYHASMRQIPTWLWLPGMIGAVAGMWAVLSAALAGSVRRSTYLVVRAFVAAELIASLQWQLEIYGIAQAPGWLRAGFMVVFDTVCLAVVYLAERRQAEAELAPGAIDIIVSAAVAAATFALSNLSFLTTSTPFSARWSQEVFYIRTLVDLCGFVVLYAQRETARKVRAARELAATRQVLISQYEQYLASKRAMDLVNRRYHDLRNLVTAIRAQEDAADRVRQLDELERSVSAYETYLRTGSPVLDVILTDKGQACRELGISLRVMADGRALAFLTPLELASVFGNALDNAIEAASQVPRGEPRAIRLDVRTRRGFVLIEVENTLDGTRRADRATGHLMTTKADRANHGFGLASIRATVHDRGGEVHAGMNEHGRFCLRVLIPRQDEEPPRPPGSQPPPGAGGGR